MTRELTYHRTRLVRSEKLTPHLRRIVLSGDELDDWETSGVPDEAVLLVIPGPTGAVDVPGPDNDNNFDSCRWYTVRAFDTERAELTIDVVGHDIGLATRWTRRAHVGDAIAVSSVRHWYNLPADARWQLLVGDITAVPAIARMLDQRPEVPTLVRIELSDPRDEVPMATAENVSVEWIHNSGPSRLEELTRSADLPSGPGYTFAAGEAAATRGVRRYLRHELGLPSDRYSVVGYWRDRSEEWFKKYLESGIDLEAIYAAGEAAGKDAEELADEVDRHLIAAGL